MPEKGISAAPDNKPKEDPFGVRELEKMVAEGKGAPGEVAFEVDLDKDTEPMPAPGEVSFDVPLDAQIPTLQPLEVPKPDFKNMEIDHDFNKMDDEANALADKMPPPDWSKLEPLDIDFNKLDAEAEERQADIARMNGADETIHPSEPLEATPAESRSKLKGLVEKLAALTGGVKEKIGSTFERSSTFLANRGKELDASLRELGQNVVADFKVAGRGIASAAAHPVETARAVGAGAERAAKYAKYFTDRSISLNDKREKFNADARTFIEAYNKLPFRQKTYITAGLIVGGAAATAMSLPTLPSIFAGGMVGGRILGGAGFTLNRRKGMEARMEKNPKHWLANKSETFKDSYAVLLGTVYSGSTLIAGRYATEKLADWLGHVFGHAPVEAPPHPAGVAHGEIMRAPAVAAVSEAVMPAPEMPSIDATPGHGYEFMAKRLWEQLQEKGLKPEDYAAGSDIRRLLEADSGSIDRVVHQIAADPNHHFFNPDGTSVRIDANAQMTIDASGQLHMSDSINAVQAPETAPVTPVYAPEAAPAGHEELVPDTAAAAAPIPETGAVPEAPAPTPEPPPTVEAAHTPDIPPQQGAEAAPAPEHSPEAPAVAEHPHAPEAPITGHEIVNKFGFSVFPDEPHIYHNLKGELTIYGGSPDTQLSAIYHYLMAHPDSTVYGTGVDIDTKAVFRVPYSFPKGTLTVGDPMPNKGIARIFSHWMKPPVPNDLRDLVE